MFSGITEIYPIDRRRGDRAGFEFSSWLLLGQVLSKKELLFTAISHREFTINQTRINPDDFETVTGYGTYDYFSDRGVEFLQSFCRAFSPVE